MSDRKAVNRYYPPDFDPQKHKSINKYRNSHPLRERAKKLSEGILVIRFEMPYNIWCNGCGKHVGMGVRYNAEKKKIGKYYSTPIYQFRMKCHLCDNYYVIETDPQNCDYKITEGARRKNQKWDMADNEQVLTEDREELKKRSRDPMFKLEHGVQDGKKLKAAIPTLSQIADKQETWKEDYMQNKMLRNKFREEKKLLKIADEEDQALLAKSSLDIPLLKESEDDKKLAALMKYSAADSIDDKQKQKREEIKYRPLFSASSKSSSPSSSSSTSSTSSFLPVSEGRNILDIQKRLGLDRLKSTHTAGFGDFDKSPSATASAGGQKRTGKSLANFGILVKKKRMLPKAKVLSNSSSAHPPHGSVDDVNDKCGQNIQELSFLSTSNDKNRTGQHQTNDAVSSSSYLTSQTSDQTFGANVQDLQVSNSLSSSKPGGGAIVASDIHHNSSTSITSPSTDSLSSTSSSQQDTHTDSLSVVPTNRLATLCDYGSSSESD